MIITITSPNVRANGAVDDAVASLPRLWNWALSLIRLNSDVGRQYETAVAVLLSETSQPHELEWAEHHLCGMEGNDIPLPRRWQS